MYCNRLLIILWSCNLAYNFDLTLLHTNDIHARIEETNKYGGSCSADDVAEGNCYGGAARRRTKIQEIRASEENVLLMDGGDMFQGTLWYYHYKGQATAHFASMLGYDVGSFGNHEFDDGPEVLSRFVKNITYPIVCCNLDSTNEPLLSGLYTDSVVLNVAGEQIGVVGYITQITPELVLPEHVTDVVFTDEIECLSSEVNRLIQSGVNKIIALGHSGFERDIEIAKAVPGVDVVIGGHTNTFLYTGTPPSNEVPTGDYPYVVTQPNGRKVYIVQGYGFGKYLGYLRITFDDQGEVASVTGNPILLDSSVSQDPVVLSEVEKWAEPLQIVEETVIGETYVYLQLEREICRTRDCNIGNLVTDAVFASQLLQAPEPGGNWALAAVALWNAGGIRAGLEQGQIKLGSLVQVLPFRNEVIGVRLQGKYIKEMLELSANASLSLRGGFLQMSGMKVVYNMDKAYGHRVHQVWIRCVECTVPIYEQLDQSKFYTLVTSQFLLSGGDGYSVLRDNAMDVIPYGFTAQDATREYIAKHQPIIHGEEGRISYVNASFNAPLPPTSIASRMCVTGTLLVLSIMCSFM